MSLSDLILHQIWQLILGDRPFLGKLRFMILFLLPISLLIHDWLGIIPDSMYAFFRTAMLIYLLGLLSAFAAAAAYVKDIYDLETDRIPFRHLTASIWGIRTPKIEISNRIQDSDEKDIVEIIGGPAFLTIRPGYAVLTETLTAPAHIYSQGGKYFISRQERVYEFIDLHEQEGVADEVTATTKDGIDVIVEKLRYNYRIWDIQWETQQKDEMRVLNPFPFSKDTIQNYVYNRSVQAGEDDIPKPFDWDAVVGGSVKGIVRGYIGEHRLDDIIASRDHEREINPREDIWKLAYSPEFMNRLRSMGTILRWWDPGEFKSVEDVEGQFLSNWSVDLKSAVNLNRAHGIAQRQAYEELGRAEAEAELLMSILHSLQGIKFATDQAQTLQNLILLRTAQVIRALNTPAHDTKISNVDSPKQDDFSQDSK